jgi:ribosomal protein S21
VTFFSLYLFLSPGLPPAFQVKKKIKDPAFFLSTTTHIYNIMALRATLLNLSHRFTSPAAPMQWMRQISNTSVLRQVTEGGIKEEASNTPALPGLLSAEYSKPSELSTSLDAYSGRSIGSVTNPNTAYRRLNAILSQNNVRRELRANRNYEKPNVTRRRKNIERNRKLFGAMIGKKVALIMQMKQRLVNLIFDVCVSVFDD